MHLLPSKLVLPEDVLSAWQLLGNGVSPAQCILEFGMYMSSLGKATAEDLLKAIQTSAVSFEGREPVCRAGWQSLELKAQIPVVPTVLEAPSDVDSDDSGRCYCNDPRDAATVAGSSCTTASDEDFSKTRIKISWDPMVPPVSEQEWELHGEMFKRIDALQNPAANSTHQVQALISPGNESQNTHKTCGDTCDRQNTCSGVSPSRDQALPDTRSLGLQLSAGPLWLAL